MENELQIRGLTLDTPPRPYQAFVMRSSQELTAHRWNRKGGDLDALVYSAEAGSAWSLIYPAYTVAVPRPDVLAVPMAYVIEHDDHELVDFVNTWINLKKKDQTIDRLYDYWILGRKAVE